MARTSSHVSDKTELELSSPFAQRLFRPTPDTARQPRRPTRISAAADEVPASDRSCSLARIAVVVRRQSEEIAKFMSKRAKNHC
ncbi:hypothetical protein AAHA92_09870 [Salvia divinorum]|uniref:Uncharacterized protein n=1 Tax=Salvia divinorum TaxID=28513 RepID=A0ABD1HSX3_SALDI